ncbi:MAG: hypothetical protein Kow0059_08550 [Candidatus Sumerlaeia bacterium]
MKEAESQIRGFGPSEHDASGLSIIIPVFNEGAMTRQVLSDVRRAFEGAPQPLEIIVVNDGSTDGFPRAEVQSLCDRLIEHTVNHGYGAAVTAGLRAARFDTCAIIDADGTYPAERLPDLLQTMRAEGAAMVVGARTGAVVQAPLLRQPAKWVLRKLADFLAGRPIPDLNSGLRVFDRSLALEYQTLYPRGFSFSSTITLAFLCNGLPVLFVPVNYYRRRGGRSKISPLRDTQGILLTILRTVMFFDPLKVLFPLSLVLGTASLAVLAAGLVTGIVLDSTIAVLALSSVQTLAIGLLADLIVRRSGR